MKNNEDIFNNLEVAYKNKSKNDLIRAYLIFLSFNYPKITKFLTSTINLCLKIKLPINFIIKRTIYKQFCGGVSINDCEKTIKDLKKFNIGTILDYSAEGKENNEDFEKCLTQILKSIAFASKSNSIPFSVFKISGIGKKEILEKKSKGEKLSIQEKKDYNQIINRVDKICLSSKEHNIPVFIDAEESWIQTEIDKIALNMMLKYNKKKIIIFNTIQFYRIDRIMYLKEIIKKANKNNFLLGLKIVRGAYHEIEIIRSKKLKYNCPVHLSKKNTDMDFNNAINICLKNIKNISICVGTHNEKSSIYLIQLMKNLKIKKDDKRVFVSQLFGMSDNISFNLAKEEYNVAKYVPYGPIKDLIPYLIRRADENKSISGQMGRELNNISKELNRRKNIIHN